MPASYPLRIRLGRLRSSSEFERLRREGGFWRGTYCSVNVARRVNAPASMGGAPVDAGVLVGFITSRKIGSAVQRNRARRLMREALRCVTAQLEPGWSVVVIARLAISSPGVRMQDVRDDLQWLLKQAQLIRAA